MHTHAHYEILVQVHIYLCVYYKWESKRKLWASSCNVHVLYQSFGSWSLLLTNFSHSKDASNGSYNWVFYIQYKSWIAWLWALQTFGEWSSWLEELKHVFSQKNKQEIHATILVMEHFLINKVFFGHT